MVWKRNREDKNEAREIIEVGHGFGLFERRSQQARA
jgi:hypothetical protein